MDELQAKVGKTEDLIKKTREELLSAQTDMTIIEENIKTLGKNLDLIEKTVAELDKEKETSKKINEKTKM